MLTKLPLAARKDIRDNFEHKLAENEAKLSEITGVSWKISFDTVALYTLAEDQFPKEAPGQCFNQYVTSAIDGIAQYLKKFGEDAKAELNKLASNHTLTLGETSDPKIPYSGCEISEGSLSLVFAEGYLGTNIDSATEKFADVINATSVASSDGKLDLASRLSIQNDWDPNVGNITKRLEKVFGVGSLRLDPNFEANVSILAASKDASLNSDWRSNLAANTLAYFEALEENLVSQDFDKDDMLQEALQEATEKKVVSYQVVGKLSRGTYHEVDFEDGTLFIRTVPVNYITNIQDVGREVLSLL